MDPYEIVFKELCDIDLENISAYTLDRLGGGLGLFHRPIYHFEKNQEMPSAFLIWAISASFHRNQKKIWKGIKKGSLRSIEQALENFDGPRMQDTCNVLHSFCDQDDLVREEVHSDLRKYFIPNEDDRVLAFKDKKPHLDLAYLFSKLTIPNMKTDSALVEFWKGQYESNLPLDGSQYQRRNIYARDAFLLMGDISNNWWGHLIDCVTITFNRNIKRVNEYKFKAPPGTDNWGGVKLNMSAEEIWGKAYSRKIEYLLNRGIIDKSVLTLRKEGLQQADTPSEITRYEINAIDCLLN